MSGARTFVRGFVGIGAVRLCSILLALVTSIVLARTLGVESFGKYAFVMALVPLLSLPVAGGLAPLLTREIATYCHNDNWPLFRGLLRASHAWVLTCSLVLLLLAWLYVDADAAAGQGRLQLVMIALLLVPLGGVNAIRSGVLKGMGMPVRAVLPVQIIQSTLFLLALSLIGLAYSLNVVTVLWVQVAAALLAYLAGSWLLLRNRPAGVRHGPTSYETLRWSSSLLPFALLAAVGTFNSQIGILMLGMLGTDEQVGGLRVADRAAHLVGLPLTLVNMVIAPYIVRARGDGDQQRLQRLAQRAARGSFAIAITVAVPLVLFGSAVITFVFGDDFARPAYLPMVLLIAGYLVNVFFGSVGYLLSMSGFVRDSVKGQVASILVNVTLCALLVPVYGALGAAAGVALGMLVRNVLLAMLVRRRLGIRPGVL